MKVKVKSLSHVWLFVTLWTIAHQGPLSMGFTRQEYWSGLPFPSPGDLPDSGIEPQSPSLQTDSLPSEPPGNPVLLIRVPDYSLLYTSPWLGRFLCSVSPQLMHEESCCRLYCFAIEGIMPHTSRIGLWPAGAMIKRNKIRWAILAEEIQSDSSHDLDTKFVIMIIFSISWASLLLTFLIDYQLVSL